MARYHLNPFSGEPNLCKATKKPCPFGSPEEHYPTKEKARAVYEEKHRAEEIATLRAEKAAHDELVSDAKREYEEKWKVFYDELYGPSESPSRKWLTPEEEALVSTEGVTCSNCEEQLTPRQAATILDAGELIECNKCGEPVFLDNVAIKVGEHKDTYAAFDSANVPKMDWTHATMSDDWDEYLQKEGGFYAHLGSEQAGFDRMIGENMRPSDAKGFWVYTLKVDETAKIASEVMADENQNWDGTPDSEKLKVADKDGEISERGLDVIRYINRWEDMASISLVANSKKITVKGKRFISRDEALRSPSLYNVDVGSNR